MYNVVITLCFIVVEYFLKYPKLPSLMQIYFLPTLAYLQDV